MMDQITSVSRPALVTELLKRQLNKSHPVMKGTRMPLPPRLKAAPPQWFNK